ncbi:RNA polymerase sigma factor [Pseudactinotalea sp. HY158]|uniref:RNA polymerase sigma factor n=1 Tax=Pseudactinotalea sp. HY158 TaxID=2654547 RepID=UPI00129CACAB|nr:RNA polymerase sigma factor [Pseudactinotalea sp. HY158]QGH68183.1 sigma-70 family RNA polymerase sigma factor [Pseudactinotalea sp. HY158]
MATPWVDLDAALAAGEATVARRCVQALDHETPAADRDEDLLTALARRAAAGSRLATELLLERIEAAGLLHRFARGALLDQAAVDDVAQEALISIASAIGTFEARSKFTTWAHRIVRHRVTDHLRRQRATAPLPESDLSEGARMSSMIATRATVRAALESLPDLYRVPVVLRDLEGLDYASIAGRLDVPVGTAKSQVARGRAMVAGALQAVAPGGARG